MYRRRPCSVIRRMRPDDDRRLSSPQSVARVLHILDALCESPDPLSLAELSRLLSTPKSSLAALLRGLVEEDFVLLTDGTYRLGPGAFGLGSALIEARRRLQSPELIRAGMRRLAARTGETVLLGVRDAGAKTLTYVDVIESQNAVRFAVSIGDRRPLYCTSGGRILLSAGTDGELRAYLKQLKPQAFTAHTELDKRRIKDAVVAARDRGVAQTVDQTADGVTGTAAVLRDASAAVLGTLIVAAPNSRLQTRAAELAQLVRDEAEEISRTLGYRPAVADRSARSERAARSDRSASS